MRATVVHLAPPLEPLEPRHPGHGALLARKFRGRDVVLGILDGVFELKDRRFKSHSAIAKEFTNSKWKGFHFFSNSGNGIHANRVHAPSLDLILGQIRDHFSWPHTYDSSHTFHFCLGNFEAKLKIKRLTTFLLPRIIWIAK